MAIPQYVSDILLISKGIGVSRLKVRKIYNIGKMFKEKFKINCYQTAYRFLLVVALSFERQVAFFFFLFLFFSQRAVNSFSLHCVTSQSTRVALFCCRTGSFHGPLSLPSLHSGRLVCFPGCVALVQTFDAIFAKKTFMQANKPRLMFDNCVTHDN